MAPSAPVIPIQPDPPRGEAVLAAPSPPLSSPRAGPAPTAAAPPAQADAYAYQRVRRYSVGREFGIEPDRIAMPAPRVMAFGSEVGAAFAASNARKDEADATLSPADQDQLDQADHDDARREARQKARDKAAAASGRN